MAAEVRITCTKCDISLDEVVGCGRSGIERLVCACDDCRIFAMREHDVKTHRPQQSSAADHVAKPYELFAQLVNAIVALWGHAQCARVNCMQKCSRIVTEKCRLIAIIHGTF
jgi:hypothetical protein